MKICVMVLIDVQCIHLNIMMAGETKFQVSSLGSVMVKSVMKYASYATEPQ